MTPNIDPIMSGPIPGENYTSDTRNYPWHRPPDFTDIDEAIDFISERLTEEETSFRMLTMIEAGLSLATVTDIFLTIGISEGRWTPDFAIILAGPTCRVLEIMAKVYEIDYDLGIDTTKPIVTSEYIKAMEKQNPDIQEEAATAVSEASQSIKDQAATQVPGGLMGPLTEAPSGSEDEQLAMLGYGAETPTDTAPNEELL